MSDSWEKMANDAVDALAKAEAHIVVLEARVAELEAKIVEIRDAWYFTDDALADQSLATVACMCGTKIQFAEPSSLGSRKVNCRCGRRWLWRWADKN